MSDRIRGIPCTFGCGRLFGGDETLKRHRDRRAERCRSDRELLAKGMYTDATGVWRRLVTIHEPEQPTLIDRRQAGVRAKRSGEIAPPRDVDIRRIELISIAGWACVDCGFRGQPEQYDFHHRPGETKRFVLSGQNLKRPWNEVRTEFAKCDLLCANCHRSRHVSDSAQARQNGARSFLSPTQGEDEERGAGVATDAPGAVQEVSS